MTLSVNTNISALNAQLFLQRSSNRFNVSLERLATGLRINRSADDPSGLVISEFQRAQLAGLSQAIRNIDRALSLAQTAEGGLAEVSGLLTQLRTLVTDSANNGALNRDSLEANQANVTNILDTIDRIANTTNFGRQSLLDAASGRRGITNAGTAAAESDFLRSINNDVVVNQNLPIVITQNAERGFVTAAPQAGNLAQDETLVINGIEIQLEAGLSRPQVIDRINQFQGQTEVFAIDVGGNRTELRSTLFGDGARVGVVSNVAAGGGGTGFGTAFQSDFGLDVVGTIGAGIAGASGSAAGSAEGLARLLTGRRGEAGSGVTIQLGLVNETDVATAGVTAANNAAVIIVDDSRLFHIGAQANDNASLTLPTVRSEALGIGIRPQTEVVVTTQVFPTPNPPPVVTGPGNPAFTPVSTTTFQNPTALNTTGPPFIFSDDGGIITGMVTPPPVVQFLAGPGPNQQTRRTTTTTTTTTTRMVVERRVDQSSVANPQNTVTISNFGPGNFIINPNSFTDASGIRFRPPLASQHVDLVTTTGGRRAIQLHTGTATTLTIDRPIGGTFSLQGVDVAQLFNAGSVTFTALPGGAQVTISSAGPIVFPAGFQNITSVTVTTTGLAAPRLTDFNIDLATVGFTVTETTLERTLVTVTEQDSVTVVDEVFTFTDEPLTPNLRSIDVRNPEAAQRALAVVERSIEEVSNFRGEVGAFTRNILQTAQSNVRSQFVNLSAAESSLRDTDFTTELTSFINEQIRRDVGTTVLGLANQNPFMIINLLQNSGNGISLV